MQLTRVRRGAVLPILVLLALSSPAAGQVPPSAASDDAHRVEAIRRYEGLLANPAPAMQSRRDEILFRLGVLYLEGPRPRGRAATAATAAASSTSARCARSTR